MCSQNSVGLYTALGFQSVTCYTYETLRTEESRMSCTWVGLCSPPVSLLLYTSCFQASPLKLT